MKKILTLFLVVVLAFSLFAGCSNKDPDLSYIITGTKDDASVTFPVGPYRFYVQWMYDYYYAYFATAAAQYNNSSFDWAKILSDTTLTSPQTLSAYIVSTAKDQYMSYLYVEEMFSRLGLEMTSEDWKQVDKIIQSDWISEYGNDGFNTIRQELGLTYEEFRTLMSSSIKSQKIVDYYYGPGGEDEVTDAEKQEYYQNNYVRFKYIVMLLQDSDGNELSEEQIGQVEENRDAILAALNGGASFEDLIKQYSGDYVTITDEMSETDRSAAEKQNALILEDGLVTNANGVFDQALATYYNISVDSAVVNKVFSFKQGEYAAVTIDDAVWIVKVYSNTEKESYYENVESAVYQALYADDLASKHTAWRNSLNYVYNEDAVNAYQPENLTNIFKFGSTTSTTTSTSTSTSTATK